MKKTTCLLMAALFCLASSNLYAKVEHGSISKKDLSVHNADGTPNEAFADAKVSFKLVTVGATTYVYMDGTGYTLAQNPYSAQIRHKGEKQCPVANHLGENLCIWTYATPDEQQSKVHAMIEDTNNFLITDEFDYDTSVSNSADASDTELPVMETATATATENSVTFTLAGSDNSNDLFFYINDAANGIETVSYQGACTVSGLMSGTDYNFNVTAIDFSGNESEAKVVKVKTSGEKPAFNAADNLALNKLSSASTGSAIEGNDGNIVSRWRSSNANEQDWWMVNLGAEYVVNRVVVKMNGDAGARGATYDIEVSLDGKTWQKVVTEATIPTGSGEELNDHTFTAAPARYVRYNGLTNGGWDHNFAELEVYGTGYYDPNAGNELANAFVTPATAVNYVGDPLQLSALATTGAGAAIPDASFTWNVEPAEGATVNNDGLFTATAIGTYTVTATTTVDGITKSGTAAIEVKEARKVTTINLARKMENNINSNWSDVFFTGEAVPYTLEVLDQYNNKMTDAVLNYDAMGGTHDANTQTVTWTEEGEQTFTVTAGEATASFTVNVLRAEQIIGGMTATASSENAEAGMTADKAVDNDFGSRWASQGTQEGVAQDEHLIVDLGTPRNLVAISAMWEGACAANYTIEVSADGIEYTSLGGEERGNGIVPHTYRVKANKDIAVQYIKIACAVPASQYGYSLFEVVPYIAGKPGPSTLTNAMNQNEVYLLSTLIDDAALRFTQEVVYAQLYSLQGQLVQSAQHVNSMNVGGLAKGIYIVKAIDEDGKSLTAKVEIR